MAAVDVEHVIRWAWTEELIKAEPEDGVIGGSALAPAWARMVGTSSTGIRLNRYGVAYDPYCRSEPHPDALRVAAAVYDLDNMTVHEEPDGDFWGIWRDHGRLGDAALASAWGMVARELSDGSGHSLLRGLASSTVVSVALSGSWPEWRGVAPKAVSECWPNGKPKWLRLVDRPVEWDADGVATRSVKVEVDGYSSLRQRPYPSAYRAERLAPDPVPVLAARIRWALIHAWMTQVAADIDGLGGRTITPPARPVAPWCEAEENLRRGA